MFFFVFLQSEKGITSVICLVFSINEISIFQYNINLHILHQMQPVKLKNEKYHLTTETWQPVVSITHSILTVKPCVFSMYFNLSYIKFKRKITHAIYFSNACKIVEFRTCIQRKCFPPSNPFCHFNLSPKTKLN